MANANTLQPLTTPPSHRYYRVTAKNGLIDLRIWATRPPKLEVHIDDNQQHYPYPEDLKP